MILRDTVQAIDDASGDVLANMRGHVGFRNVSHDDSPGGGAGFQVVRRLSALTPPWDWIEGDHRLRWRGEDYRVVGVLWRRRNGRDHHVTLDIERTTG